jgi:hypothetical protein
MTCSIQNGKHDPTTQGALRAEPDVEVANCLLGQLQPSDGRVKRI